MSEINRKSPGFDVEQQPDKTREGETWKNELKKIAAQVRQKSKELESDKNPE
jgi:hypothetical protein